MTFFFIYKSNINFDVGRVISMVIGIAYAGLLFSYSAFLENLTIETKNNDDLWAHKFART